MTASGDRGSRARGRMTIAGTARPLAVGGELAVPGEHGSRDPRPGDCHGSMAVVRWCDRSGGRGATSPRPRRQSRSRAPQRPAGGRVGSPAVGAQRAPARCEARKLRPAACRWTQREPPMAGARAPRRGQSRDGPDCRVSAGRMRADQAAPGRPLVRPAHGAGDDSRRRRRSRRP